MSITFEKMSHYDPSLAEQSVWAGEELVAVIEKHNYDAGATSVEWRADYYVVEFWKDGDEGENKTFHVSEFRNAREAHTAAKAHVRRTVS